MTDEDLRALLQATAAGRRLDWFISLHDREPLELSASELNEHFATPGPLAAFRQRLLFNRERLGQGLGIVAIDDSEPGWVSATLRGSNGRYNRFLMRVETDAPHRILATGLFAAPPGWTIRPAVPADAPALAELERRAPLVLGDVEVVYDRGSDYFAAERLMGNAHTFVVEFEGEPVGLNCEVVHDVRIAGDTFPAEYNHRLRLLPAGRGHGASGLLSEARMRVAVPQGARMQYAFISADNRAALEASSPALRWPLQPERIVIATNPGTSAPIGRPASATDIARLAELFNQTHTAEELFVPYTGESLRARFMREPSAYSWSNVLLSPRAAAGVWDAGLVIDRTSPAGRTVDRRALVLDFGFEPHAESELVKLLGQWSDRLNRAGPTELSIFSSPPSPGYAALAALAKRREPYFVSCPAMPGPEVESHGVYVDQLYF